MIPSSHAFRRAHTYLWSIGQLLRRLRGQTWLGDVGFQNARLAQWAQERLGLAILMRRRESADWPRSQWLATLDQVRR